MLNLFGLLVAFLCLALYARTRRDRYLDKLPFPPGPKALPFIGNLRDIPMKDEAIIYNQWARKYGMSFVSGIMSLIASGTGPLVYANVLGRHLLFVNSAKVAADLFEKRSANYSDRNALPMINDLYVYGFLRDYGVYVGPVAWDGIGASGTWHTVSVNTHQNMISQ
jgi:hypothetical protein